MSDELKDIEDIQKDISDIELPNYGYPEPVPKDSIFKFFREILLSDDSKKVGNLTNEELGRVRMGVRHWLDLAVYAEAEDLDRVGLYLRARAENIVSTSMSRKGFLAQLFVTQIKKEQKVKEQESTQKKGWFSRKVEGNAETTS